MTLFILGFIAIGIAFGIATARRQHRFSEGGGRADRQGHRGLWVLLCSLLWPLMLLSGLHNSWQLAKARHAQRKRS